MKKSFGIHCAIVLFFIHFSYAQDKAKSLNDSIKKYFYTNPSKAKTFCHKLMFVSNRDHLTEQKVVTYCYLSDLSGVLNQRDSVFYFFDKGIQTAKDNQDQNLEMVVKVNKAKYLFNQFDFDGALTLFNECLNLSKKLNDRYTYNYVLLQKASISYELEKYEDALAIYKQSMTKEEFNIASKLDVRLGLVKTYIKLKKADSAYIFITKGIQEAQHNSLKEHEIFFLMQLGAYHIDKKDYGKAEETFQKALKIAQNTQNSNVIAFAKIDLSKLYTIKKEFNLAVENLEGLLNQNKDNIPIEYLSEIYYLLGENYKQLNNPSKSSYYLEQFIESSKKIGQKRVEAVDHLHRINVEEIKAGEEIQMKYRWAFTFLSLALIVIILLVVFRKRKKEKQDHLKFEALLLKIQRYEDEKASNSAQQDTSVEEITKPIVEFESPEMEEILDEEPDQQDFLQEEDIEENTEEGKEQEHALDTFTLKSETIDEILDKLIKLEEKKLFLRQDFTLHNVAKRLKTNTAYLSKIINNELGKSFSTYVNELRINYIIIELKNNTKLRSYSVQAIANEIGYKSSESFSKYFKIATGISPTAYIKNINELNRNNSL